MWQKIEDAPKDDTAVLVMGGAWVGEVGGEMPQDCPVVAIWMADSRWVILGGDYYNSYIDNPTHFCHIPEWKP